MTCQICGGPLGKGRTVYCSRHCMAQGYARRAADRRSPCTECGAEGRTRRGLCAHCYARTRRAENPEAYRAAQARRRRQHPDRERLRSRLDRDRKYFDGKKEVILADRGAVCADCGATEGDKSGRALHLHHDDHSGLTTIGDRRRVNNNPENLIPLCGSCHMKRHQRRMGRGQQVTITCGHCGKAISDFPWRHRRFCDHTCALKHRHAVKRGALCSA